MRAQLAGLLCVTSLAGQTTRPFDAEPFEPRRAICHRAAGALTIDGRLDETSWVATPWSDAFVDIEGSVRPKPRLQTRVKMLWDNEYFYIGAEMEEPDVWATLTERDSIIFHDNDFEVFIDPDGDTHEYYELEVNALNTVWDLMLLRPYRDGGPAVNAWDITGLKTGVHVRGTLNRPGDMDEGWTVEIALPWKVLQEAAPEQRAPKAGEQWRVNFSRVQWSLEVKNGVYTKRTSASGTPLPEDNWVWSAQGAVAMHMPERWGYVQFSGSAPGGAAEDFVADPDEPVRWRLRQVYYRQVEFRKANGRYARTLAALKIANSEGVLLHATDDLYVLQAPSKRGGTIYLRQDGRIWRRSDTR